MGPAVREKMIKRPPNYMHKPAIWKDEMVEVRETFRRIACIKSSHFSSREKEDVRTGPILSRNRIARIRNQVPFKSLHIPVSKLKEIQNNRSQPPSVSLNHLQNVIGMCRRIQSQNSLTERRKNPNDLGLYPVFIRRPVDGQQERRPLTARARIHGDVPFAYSPPKFNHLRNLSNPVVLHPPRTRPSSAGSARPSTSPIPSNNFGKDCVQAEIPATASGKHSNPAIRASKDVWEIPVPPTSLAERPILSDRTHVRSLRSCVPLASLSVHRRPHSAEDLRTERPPSRCSRRKSSCSSSNTASSLSTPDSQSFSAAGSLTPETTTTNSSRSSTSRSHMQERLFTPRHNRTQRERRNNSRKGSRSGKICATGEKPQRVRPVISSTKNHALVSMEERQTGFSGEMEYCSPKQKVTFATLTSHNNPVMVEAHEASVLASVEHEAQQVDSADDHLQEQQGQVIIKHSADPYVDFKNSMLNLIQNEHLETNEIQLEELFQYYLDLNPALHTILQHVISDVRKELKLITKIKE